MVQGFISVAEITELLFSPTQPVAEKAFCAQHRYRGLINRPTMRMTVDEIRLVVALLLAVLIGTATKHYRENASRAELRQRESAVAAQVTRESK